MAENRTNGFEPSVDPTSTDVVNFFNDRVVNSMKHLMMKDPESDKFYPNHRTRKVSKGHFVEVEPEGLKEPFLISVSHGLIKEIGLDNALSSSNEASETSLFKASNLKQFQELASIFSGQLKASSQKPFATAYAVSVGGFPIVDPDNFGGYAYGDGRALSIGEFEFENNKKYEFQLKGSGRTPFSRTHDGRAVLRSSIREFLVSELMHTLRVPTTRGLSLVTSLHEDDFVRRPWYYASDMASGEGETRDQRLQRPPNVMQSERCAIATRACSSFIRIGHFELFSRRAREGDLGSLEELRNLTAHTISRHYPEIKIDPELSVQNILDFMRSFMHKQSELVVSWLRVGYVQGNMNSDNILLNGCTMDYGPFGFLEQYDPLWNPFTSDPHKNFGFENQPRASHINFVMLIDSMCPLLEDIGGEEAVGEAKTLIGEYSDVLMTKARRMRGDKMGIANLSGDDENRLWIPLMKFLKNFDYTLFWRSLIELNEKNTGNLDKFSFELVKDIFESSCYTDFMSNQESCKEMMEWINMWSKDKVDIGLMKKSNPVFVAREWMLVEAYSQVQKVDFESVGLDNIIQYLSLVYEKDISAAELWKNDKEFPMGKFYALQKLFVDPYCDTDKEAVELFCKKTPTEKMNAPGTAFYSCSS